MNVLFLMANGFEETEFVTPFDYWQRGGLNVALASIGESEEVVGAHGLAIKTNVLLSDLIAEGSLNQFDAVCLPGGGPGVKNLKASAEVAEVLKTFDAAGKWIFAICAAPLVLSQAGLLKNRKCTCFPGCEVELDCKQFLTDRVVVDGNVITSRGAGTAEEFAFECLAQATNRETSEKIRNQVVAR
ncbi:DJ-1 family glyoxalase III [Fibrobacter sp. UWEL]|uniref:DJ-1 family glyoxalase III n=1 Tax=Fibrobacter sp. UWEL TaxID=1896209 RepID=UPI0009114C6D|nr:DJ-1 family glyoxalase III [Fibrobacter sp. UWEL]SHK29807.1 4-methyl-5(b-hydroxyethyl)-thiazole monophosphate biosynthesis [Fibrobacter sp. UWEL]